MKNFCILIPSFNEAKTIGQLTRRLLSEGYTVYVADDGSWDRTGEIASSEGAIVIRHESNMGKGTAIRDGIAQILSDNGHDMVVMMDGDGQHDVADIPRLVERMKETGAGMVIGNRMQDISKMPLIRVIVNKYMSILISMFAHQRIPDSQSGFRVVRKDVLKNISLESSKYEIESEMIILVARAGFKIESTPIRTVYESEKSRINPLRDTLRFIRLMIRLCVRR